MHFEKLPRPRPMQSALVCCLLAGFQLACVDSGRAGSQSAVDGSSSSIPTNSAAIAAVAAMNLGWNLGNSLDCTDASKADTVVETSWGNPVVTADLIKAVAAAGFGAVRIPVTWIGRFGPAPDYTISPTFINRVEEVVKYVLDANLYAIINIHHDGGYKVAGRWLSLVDSSGLVTPANTEQVKTQ